MLQPPSSRCDEFEHTYVQHFLLESPFPMCVHEQFLFLFLEEGKKQKIALAKILHAAWSLSWHLFRCRSVLT